MATIIVAGFSIRRENGGTGEFPPPIGKFFEKSPPPPMSPHIFQKNFQQNFLKSFFKAWNNLQTTRLALNSHKNITLPPSQAFLHPKTTILRFQGGHFYFALKFQVFQVFQTTFSPFSSGFLIGRWFFSVQIPGFPGFPEKISKYFQVFSVSLRNNTYSNLFQKTLLNYNDSSVKFDLNCFLDCHIGKKLHF